MFLFRSQNSDVKVNNSSEYPVDPRITELGPLYDGLFSSLFNPRRFMQPGFVLIKG